MKRIEIAGLGVHIEIYQRNDKYTDLEALKEAEKAVRREVIRYETRIGNSANRPANDDGIQERS